MATQNFAKVVVTIQVPTRSDAAAELENIAYEIRNGANEGTLRIGGKEVGEWTYLDDEETEDELSPA